MRLRPAREGDLDRLIEIHRHSFPDGRNHEARRLNFVHNRLRPFEGLQVAEEDGTIVGHGVAFTSDCSVGGRMVPVGAIGALAVAPEARGRGLGTAMLHEMHAQLRAADRAFTLLYPYREGYYERLGYAPTCPFLSLRFRPRALGPSLARQARPAGHGTAEKGTVRLFPLSGEHADSLQTLYAQSSAHTSGSLRRSHAYWERRLCDESSYWVGWSESGKLRGIACLRTDNGDGLGPSVLVVEELWTDQEAHWASMLQLLFMQRDAVESIRWERPWDDALVFAMADAGNGGPGPPPCERPLGMLSAGPMVQVLHRQRMLEQRGYQGEGEIVLRIEEDENGGAEMFRLQVHAGTARVEPLDEMPVASDPLSVDARAFASLVVNGMTVAQAQHLGALRGSPHARNILSTLLSGPRFHCSDVF